MRVPSQNDNPNINGGYPQQNFSYNNINQMNSGTSHLTELDPYAPAIVQDLLQVLIFNLTCFRVQMNGKTFKTL